MIIPAGSIVIGRADGAKALLNLATGQMTTLQADDPTPVTPTPKVKDVPPAEPDTHPATAADVTFLYQTCLGRPPEDAGAIEGRLGRPFNEVADEICNSDEAKAHAGTKPVGPAGPEGPPAGPKPVGPTGPQGPKGGGSSTTPNLPGVTDVQKAWDDLLAKLHEATDAATADARKAWDETTHAVGLLTVQSTKLIETAASALEKRIGASLGTAVPNMLSLIGAGLGGAESLVASFLSSAADVGDLAGAFVGAIKNESDPLGNWLVGVVGYIMEHAATSALAAVPDRTPVASPPLGASVEATDEIEPELAIPVNPLNPPGSVVEGLSRSLEIALGFIVGAFSLVEPGKELMAQYAWSNAPVRIPEASEALAAEIRGYISVALSEEIARRHGYDAPAHSIARELAKTRPDAGALFTAYFRGAMDTPELARGMKRLGYDERAREIMVRAAVNIAGPGEIMRLADRGLIGPSDVDLIGEEREAEDAVSAELARHGYEDDEARRLWRAHYRPLDPNTAAEAVHRGKLAAEAYPLVLRQNGIAPFARVVMQSVLYAPYSRRDLLRLVKLGLLDHAGLVEAVQAIGYDAEKAEVLATMFERLAGDDAAAEKKAIRRELTSHIVNRYKAGGLERADAGAHLTELEISPGEVEAMLLGADLDVESERAAKIEKLVRPFYVDGVWTGEQVRAVLNANDLAVGRIDRLLTDWDFERLFAALKPDHAKARDLTKDELTTAFVARAIDEPAYRAQLEALTYDPDEVNTLVTLALIRQHKEELKDQLAEVEHLVRVGKIDEASASAALDKIGVKPGERDRLLDSWYRQKVLHPSELTFGQISDMAKAAIIDEDQADALLARLPYSDEERVLLLALMGYKVAQQTARDAAAAAKKEKAAAVPSGGQRP